MKREKQESCGATEKGKMAAEMEEDAGVDELLAALGYKVRSSEMADVAQKLEQLEMAMAAAAASSSVAAPDDVLASDTVHYNPSDLSSWLESMLSELNAPPPPPLPPRHLAIPDPLESSTITTLTSSPPVDPAPSRSKRMRTSSSSSSPVGSLPPTTTSSEVSSVVVDSQEAGIRLVHTLMACAEAVQHDNLKAADALVKQIPLLAASQGGAMRKVAGYFAEALARRIYDLRPQQEFTAFDDILHMSFYETCPYLKFAHFTANQAILEAADGCRRLHVIDFSMKQGMQWPALMQAIALRPGGPPAFRLTGIGPPQSDNTDALQQVGWKLAQLAESVGVEFHYRGFVHPNLADLEPYMLETSPAGDETEVVAVNSVFELHQLLARPGAVDKVLGTVRAIRPTIVTVVEQEASHNGTGFAERFNEALHYYSTMFDSLEGGWSEPEAVQQEQVMTEVYLGRQICNVVACEGAERTERHETAVQWRRRMNRAGFDPVHLGSNAYKQVSMLLKLYAGGDGYRVEEKEGCLTLGWHTRPLIATSAWRPSAAR